MIDKEIWTVRNGVLMLKSEAKMKDKKLKKVKKPVLIDKKIEKK